MRKEREYSIQVFLSLLLGFLDTKPKIKTFAETKSTIVLKLIPFVILFFISSSAFSQILNIERYRIKSDTAKNLSIKTTAGLNVFNRSAAADAPVNLFGYKWDINSMYHPGKHAYIFVSNFDYLRINDNDFLNFGLIHGRTVFNYDKKNNLEAFVQYSFDNFRGLAPRWITGGTLRKKLIDSKRLTFIIGLGALYENETWFHPVEENFVNVEFLKNSNYFSLRWTINQFVDFNTVIYYQVGRDREIEAFRNRVNGNFNLNTKITDRFSFNNSFNFSYEDKPIVPITPFIFSFNTGISFDF
ncbi:DUF481 domain-containing protein [Mongoliibacter ruber]|uniref:Uncharacterized protein DUF481 n=1 Tax=Mongoliibacter ruber TaxID=1750599 RepID=A0A2T0WQX8_9BACT|nr:DUF481 domain-containing protein [Mongoliibacter ruber]PRY89096.1 uncharacterized protein DUF481 [Mongoliibacter ruber]